MVVMTTRVVERGRTKCGQYWPPEEGASLTFGQFEVTSGAMEQNDDYTVTSLTLTNTKVNFFFFCKLILILHAIITTFVFLFDRRKKAEQLVTCNLLLGLTMVFLNQHRLCWSSLIESELSKLIWLLL